VKGGVGKAGQELFQLLDEPYPLFEGTTEACPIER
jgi:hypothetical protein